MIEWYWNYCWFCVWDFIFPQHVTVMVPEHISESESTGVFHDKDRVIPFCVDKPHLLQYKERFLMDVLAQLTRMGYRPTCLEFDVGDRFVYINVVHTYS